MPVKYGLAIVTIGVLLFMYAIKSVFADDLQQGRITATPLPISLASPTPPSTVPIAATETPIWTATPVGPAVLEAIDEANVRAEPDVESELLGRIRPGEIYPIVGRYFEWYQFRYDSSPNGRGWVFGQLVNVTGDPSAIPDLSAELAPTTDPLLVGAGAALAETPTPLDPLTSTAQARVLPAPDAVAGISGVSIDPNAAVAVGDTSTLAATNVPGLLPTFTYPPNIVAAAPTDILLDEVGASPTPSTPAMSVSQGIPPIVPILVLGGFGILGLAISSLRR